MRRRGDAIPESGQAVAAVDGRGPGGPVPAPTMLTWLPVVFLSGEELNQL